MTETGRRLRGKAIGTQGTVFAILLCGLGALCVRSLKQNLSWHSNSPFRSQNRRFHVEKKIVRRSRRTTVHGVGEGLIEMDVPYLARRTRVAFDFNRD